MKREVKIVPYDDKWRYKFELIKEKLLSIFLDLVIVAFVHNLYFMSWLFYL